MSKKKLMTNLTKEREVLISLTGTDSHKIILEPGVGSFSIGTKGLSNGTFDVWVEKNDLINWDAFNGLYIPASMKEKDKKPYGDWPRFFYYSGNDLGFIEWSVKREIEQFVWCPQKDIVVDLTKSNIHHLGIHAQNNIQIFLESNIYNLDLYGNLDKYTILKCGKTPFLSFYPKYEKNTVPYKLPIFKCFMNATEVRVSVDPNNTAFDCESLLQFPNIEKLSLIGNMTNLNALKELKKIEKIGIWDMKNLSNFPRLDNWKNLNSFVAVNVEENNGKKLRKELKELIKEGRIKDYSTVSNLRSVGWFETNYGIPFSYWKGKNEKKAMAIYNTCLKKVNKSKTNTDIKNAVIEYTEEFNKLDDIETIESNDIYVSLCKIMRNSPFKVNFEEWFNETREF